ncbi:MAG: hypothetical protein PWP23_2311 [Candidatus Sumerlaeota bacterium]|nr:hypothetical protein [Candidatus Sumerlaeota bacterium]
MNQHGVYQISYCSYPISITLNGDDSIITITKKINPHSSPAFQDIGKSVCFPKKHDSIGELYRLRKFGRQGLIPSIRQRFVCQEQDSIRYS